MTACARCCEDDGMIKGESGLCYSCQDFQRGYDMGAHEVLSAVRKRDAALYRKLAKAFPPTRRG